MPAAGGVFPFRFRGQAVALDIFYFGRYVSIRVQQVPIKIKGGFQTLPQAQPVAVPDGVAPFQVADRKISSRNPFVLFEGITWLCFSDALAETIVFLACNGITTYPIVVGEGHEMGKES